MCPVSQGPWRLRVSVLMFAFFLISAPHWLVLTLTTLRLAERGFDALSVGLFAALPWVTILAVSPFVARLARRFGERSLPTLALLIESLAVAGFALHDGIAWWLVCQVLLGIGGAVIWVFAEGWVPAMTPSSCQGRVGGVYETVAGLAIMSGPGLVPWVIDQGALPFVGVVIAYALGGLVILWVGPPTIGVASAITTTTVPKTRVSSLPGSWWPYVGLMLPAFVGGFFEAGASAVLPLAGVGVGMAAGSAALLVTVLGAGSFAAQLPLGALSDRFCAQRMMRWCTGLAAVTALLWAWASAMQMSWALWPVAAVWGALGGGVYTLAMVRLGRAYRGAQLLPASSALVFAYTLGTAVSPAVNGLALDHSPGAVPVLFALVAGLGWWGLVQMSGDDPVPATVPVPAPASTLARAA